MTHKDETLAYRAGRAFARMKPISPAAFAAGGLVGFCALSLLGAASSLLANAMLIVLIAAIAYELLCRARP